MDTRLQRTLTHLLVHAPKGRTDWWLIGSAALSVMGLDVVVRDVDLLTTLEGGQAWLAAFGVEAVPKSGDAKFRSKVFKSLAVIGGLELEIMGDLMVNTPDGWQGLIPQTRRAISTPAGMVYVPETAEMLAILTLFGRPKDMDRAALLRETMRL
jgi:hypothetical protein